jgi:energy-coupling factor transport system substrate-specific component
MKTRTFHIQTLCFLAITVAINIIGGFLALILRLPIYLDSMGTILSALILGPFYGALTGLMTALVNGATFDPVSFYFAPVYVVTGLVTGFLFRDGQYTGIKAWFSIILIGLLISSLSSLVVSIVFNGVTSSGSSYIVAVLHSLGMDLTTSIFVTQVATDVLDKSLAFLVDFAVLQVTPSKFLEQIKPS